MLRKDYICPESQVQAYELEDMIAMSIQDEYADSSDALGREDDGFDAAGRSNSIWDEEEEEN
jgi:hypothetical protein